MYFHHSIELPLKPQPLCRQQRPMLSQFQRQCQTIYTKLKIKLHTTSRRLICILLLLCHQQMAPILRRIRHHHQSTMKIMRANRAPTAASAHHPYISSPLATAALRQAPTTPAVASWTSQQQLRLQQQQQRQQPQQQYRHQNRWRNPLLTPTSTSNASSRQLQNGWPTNRKPLISL